MSDVSGTLTAVISCRCEIAPPSLLLRVAERGGRDARDAALRTLLVSAALRSRRTALGATLRRFGLSPADLEFLPAQAPATGPENTVYDAAGGEEEALPGRRVRGTDDPPTGDAAVDQAFDGAAATATFYREVFGRDSIDGRGLDLVSSVHFRRRYDNAFWTGDQMVYGDGGGGVFVPGGLTRSLAVIAHELTHGVTQFSAGLEYRGQSGALNESFSDVFGVLVEHRAGYVDAASASWLVGEGILDPSLGGALRNMIAPGTAYSGDDQPADMDAYADLPADDDPRNDNGGVHINSGIPNRAFAEAARTLGGRAWETVGPIWYEVLTGGRLAPTADFAACAALTVTVAGERYGESSAQQDAVRGGWEAVKVRLPADPR
ncbi:M4 family metallopeptidase [Actinomycetospora straminea]|uniref:Neutral metalloproteinase n=1 Tax=Actinomycetospora straminea TaxID=663607 RepID=A0ABP9FAD4_9PSEU